MKILIVEDAAKVARLLAGILLEEGHATEICGDGVTALERTVAGAPDLIVLDWMLPDVDGPTVCRSLRQRGVDTPVLMLTARAEPDERIIGLDSGADDYLVKPFDIEEFLARIRALQRRSQRPAGLHLGSLSIDSASGRVGIDGQVVELTPREYRLLLMLARSAGQVVRRTELLSEVWGIHHDPSSKVVEVQMSRLRDKLGEQGALIETVRGKGYRLRTSRWRTADESPDLRRADARGTSRS